MRLFSYLSILAVSLSLQAVFADTCPLAQGLNPNNPPVGWKLLLPPVLDGQHYFFSAAIHSLNMAYYDKHIICKYAACSTPFCPAFALISDKEYQYPNIKVFPWDAKSVLAFTLTCLPLDRDPLHCDFN